MPSLVLWEGCREADKVMVLSTTTEHIAEGSFNAMTRGRIFACATGMVIGDVAAVDPAVVRVVVLFAGGPDDLAVTFVVAAVVGAITLLWCWGCCLVLSCKCLG